MEARRIPGLSRLWRRVVARAGLLACVVFTYSGSAQASDLLTPEAPASEVVQTPLDKSVALKASGPVGRVVVSQPEVVEVALAGPDQIYVIGRELGSANLLVYDLEGQLSQSLELRVGYDVEGLRETLAAALPDRTLTVTGLAAGVVVEGELATPAEAKAVEALAQRVAPNSVISRLHVQNAVVRVDVRIAEVSSRRLRQLGASLSIDDGHLGVVVRDVPLGASPPHTVATLDTHVGDYRLTAALRALEEAGDARVVAQPMLAVASGARGDFHTGGELPFAVPADDNTVVVEFRPYGAGLKVIPTVQANGLVQLQLEAELSEIDPRNRINLGGVQVPGLLTRRVGSVAELRDGQTLMLAGLLQQEHERRAVQTPWLAKIPILGTALRSAQARDTERELAIFVTPHVAEQVPPNLVAVGDRGPEPGRTVTPEPRRVAAKGPRGPPLRLIARELRDAVAPPARWLLRMARRAASALA